MHILETWKMWIGGLKTEKKKNNIRITSKSLPCIEQVLMLNILGKAQNKPDRKWMWIKRQDKSMYDGCSRDVFEAGAHGNTVKWDSIVWLWQCSALTFLFFHIQVQKPLLAEHLCGATSKRLSQVTHPSFLRMSCTMFGQKSLSCHGYDHIPPSSLWRSPSLLSVFTLIPKFFRL